MPPTSNINTAESQPLLSDGRPQQVIRTRPAAQAAAPKKQFKAHDDFGTEPPYDPPCAEDKSNVFQRCYFNYIHPFIHKAAEEKLSEDYVVFPLWRPGRSWNAGANFEKEYSKRTKRLHLWDRLVGQEVTKSNESGWTGTLKYVGFARNSQNPGKVICGVEWSAYPQDAPIGKFHDGTVNGEVLFEAANRSATIEDPKHIRFLSSDAKRVAGGTPPVAASSFSALMSCFGLYLAAAALPRIVFDIATLSMPVILEWFVSYLSDDNSTWGEGLGIVATTFFVSLVASAMFHRHFYMTMRSGLEMSAALQATTFQQAFHISQKGRTDPDLNAGRIVTLLSVDAFNIESAAWWIHYTWSVPLQMVIGIYLLYRLVNYSAFVGLGVMLLSMPLTASVAKLQHSTQQALIKVTDERVKATNELFNGIRIVKFMGWEKMFSEKVNKLRTKELKLLKKMQMYRVLNQFVSSATPPMIIASVFVMFHLSGHTLTPKIVFPTISLLGILRIPFMVVPMMVQFYVSAWVSMKRFDQWLSADTSEDSDSPHMHGGGTCKVCPDVMHLKDATVRAFMAESLPEAKVGSKGALCCKHPVKVSGNSAIVPKPILKDFTVTFPTGKLTIIGGPTGSGKTTLLSALLGELEVSGGECVRDNRVAYVPQQPWVMNDTVEGNITFFGHKDEERLEHAIKVSQLGPDIELFEKGLATEIGEKGVSMSGGQKARLCMARAVYANRDVYILDDPISAVDTKVGEAMINDCICGALKGKTVILVTHHTHYGTKADHFIQLDKDGNVAFQGDYCNYIAQEDPEAGVVCKVKRKKSSIRRKAEAGGDGTGDIGEEVFSEEEDSDDEEDPLLIDKKKKSDGPKKDGGSEEEKAQGSVPMTTYLDYFRACGGVCYLVITLIVFTITEVINAANMIWLTIWASKSYDLEENTYLYVYLGIVALMTTSNAIRAALVFAILRVGSYTLHRDLLANLAIARTAFFDTTPIGRILNRFSKDITKIDNDLPSSFLTLLSQTFAFLDNIIVMTVSQPATLIALFPVAGVYYKILLFYNSSNREIKRVSALRNSPVFALMTEALNGTGTIKAFGRVRAVVREATRRIDATISATALMHLANRWLGIRLELLGNITVSVVALSSVIMHQTREGPQSVGMLSLAFTTATMITGGMNWLVRSIANVESDMNAVERVLFYSRNVDTEDTWSYSLDKRRPDESEPGSMEFKDVVMRYRPELPIVLNNVSFKFPAQAKIGVIGRSGSGKSTLMQAMLRTTDTESGAILIGGVDSRNLTLEDLRSKFAMIPQEPLLFEGTLRSNMDPFKENNDADIWGALSKVNLEEVCKKEGGLTMVVSDGGENFSVGQRQLLCLARALLKNNTNYILLDEATANIDNATDKLIQDTVKDAFQDKTVITIAHRLHTVAQSDYVLVMDTGGFVGEFGTPSELNAKADGIFRSMIAALGPDEERKVVSMIQSA